MRNAVLTISLLLAGLACAGCGTGQPYINQDRLDKGLVIVLTGIEGRSEFNRAICRGLDHGGVGWAIELYDWTPNIPLKQILPPVAIYNQRAEGRNRRKAEQLANRIVRYQMAYPGRPVVLVGQSGGSAIAAWAAEALPYNHKVEGIVMLSPSLSPSYTLEQALTNCRRGLVNFYSARDLFFLALGTTVTGTMDGEHTQSAGRVGFEIPLAGGKPAAYEKLHQIAWSEKMADTGNYGIHLSGGGARFVAAYVAPLVLARQWDTEQIAHILNRDQVQHSSSRPANWRPGMSLEEETRPATRTAGASSRPHPMERTGPPVAREN